MDLEQRHNRQAPFWAAGLVLLGTLGLATVWLDFGTFWKGYVLDICGPAWNYILFRGRFTAWTDNRWTRFFRPSRTFTLFASFLVAVEVAQFLELYDATYDPWDFLAYFSLLLPLFLLDRFQLGSPKGGETNSRGE